jgi:hypothetical protein
VTPAAIAWAGFAGSWLLVAGPVYQAAIDFQAEDLERSAIRDAADATAKPPPFSRWWWLIPPVGYALQIRRSRADRRGVMTVLTSAQMELLVRFGNKATGWILISLGAFPVALTETWTLRGLRLASGGLRPGRRGHAAGLCVVYGGPPETGRRPHAAGEPVRPAGATHAGLAAAGPPGAVLNVQAVAGVLAAKARAVMARAG